ncbi:MLP-like protein 28 [Striga hermonthica]|uniref:MLP-like protein 28 n=1 Tax=Striga hermonthica TaxID=68872 RepID=A0A9N7NQJ6_STRHE|nr:MLP-like protein 28 [Striga hermonthica]
MGLTGKLIAAIEFEAGGDVFHQLFRHTPHHVSTASPDKVQGCDLIEGDFGHVGSIICWRYTHDGKEKTAKQLIKSIDEEKKLMEFKMLEGDLMEEYKDFIITIHVETKGHIDLVTWTLEYEMLDENVEHPISLLAYFIALTKDIETHHVGKP